MISLPKMGLPFLPTSVATEVDTSPSSEVAVIDETGHFKLYNTAGPDDFLRPFSRTVAMC